MAKFCCLCGKKLGFLENCYSCNHLASFVENPIPIIPNVSDEEGLFCELCTRAIGLLKEDTHWKNCGPQYSDDECLDYVNPKLPNIRNQALREAIENIVKKKQGQLDEENKSEEEKLRIEKEKQRIIRKRFDQVQRAHNEMWSAFFKNNPAVMDNQLFFDPLADWSWMSRDSKNFFLAEKAPTTEDFLKETKYLETIFDMVGETNPLYNWDTVNFNLNDKLTSYNIKLLQIPINSIFYYRVMGELRHYTEIEGYGGGVNADGAIVGGLLYGTAGAIVGSQIGTETHIHSIQKTDDSRYVILKYTNANSKIVEENFDYGYYEALKSLIPEKEFDFVNLQGNQTVPEPKAALQANNARQPEPPALASAPAEAPKQSPIAQLKEFKELLDMGIITQEEFDQKKKQLLNL